MTSPKQAAANRRNAQRSTGPRTEAGKALASRNALRHGILSRVEVLPGLEDAADYEEHVRRTHEALVPVGYLEETLADRVASVAWRLGRVVRAERDAAAARLAKFDEFGGDRIALAYSAERATWAAAAWKDDLDAEDAETVLDEVRDALGGDDDARAVLDAAAAQLEDGRKWSAKALGKVVRDALEAAGVEETAEEFFRARLEEARACLEAFDRKRERERRERALPAARDLEPLARYETTLERSLYKALHELQRLQAVRAGNAVPPPVAVDVTVSPADLQ